MHMETAALDDKRKHSNKMLYLCQGALMVWGCKALTMNCSFPGLSLAQGILLHVILYPFPLVLLLKIA